MKRTLARNSLRYLMVLVILGIVIGAFQIWFGYSLTKEYLLESYQTSHWKLADEFADHIRPYLAQEVSDEELRKSLDLIESLNPLVKAYILDRHGVIRVATHRTDRINIGMQAIDYAIESHKPQFPLLGDDPLSIERQTLFSVKSIAYRRKPAYLYLTLGGHQQASLMDKLAGDYLVNATFLLLAGSFGLGLLVVVPASFVILRAYDRMSGVVEHVTHDIRSPLTTLRGYMETLMVKHDSLNTAEREMFLGVALRQTHNLSEHIHEILDGLNKPLNSENMDFHAFHPRRLCERVIERYRMEAQAKSIELSMLTDDLLPSVTADEKLIDRALSNLVENAIRYTPAGGEVIVEVTRFQDRVYFSVADTGIGISEKELQRVFDRFYRGKTAKEHSAKGSGLGLALVKKVVEAHDSKLKVRSQVECGTEFEFALPVDGSCDELH